MTTITTELAQAAEHYRVTLDAHRNNPRDAAVVEAWDEATSKFMALVNNDELNIISELMDKLSDAGGFRDSLFSANRRIAALSNVLAEKDHALEAKDKQIAELSAAFNAEHEQLVMSSNALIKQHVRANMAQARITEMEARTEQQPVSFDELRDAVAEMSGGRPVEWEFGCKGHQAVPFINFNSLSRIVEKFRVAPAPIVPDGWVTAPAEPTMKMVFSGASAKRDDGSELWNANAIYRAMLAAAPKEGK